MIRPLLKLVRFPLVLTAVADSAAGYLIARPEGGEVSWSVLGWLAGASACLYMSGMALNDVADVKRDRELHPERPIPSGKIGFGAAAIAGVVLLGAGVALAVPVGKAVAMLAASAAAGILLYNLVLKSYGISGALMMGIIRGLNLTMGLAAARVVPAQGWFELPLAAGVVPYHYAPVLLIYIFVVTMISLLEESDKPEKSFRVLWIIQMLVVLGTLGLHFPPHPAGACAAVGLVAWLLYSGSAVKDAKDVMGHIRLSILCVIAFDATFLLARAQIAEGAGILALLIPSFLMIRVYRHV